MVFHIVLYMVFHVKLCKDFSIFKRKDAMRQCNLERLEKQKNKPQLIRTGEMVTFYLEGIIPEMIGSILEIRHLPEKWVLNSVVGEEIICHQIKRNSYVGTIEAPKEVPAPIFEEANEPEEKE